MKECANCGFHENGVCVCPPYNKWYACQIENKKPENVQALKEWVDFARRQKIGKMSKSMYKQGKRIESISEFDQCESLWYKWNGKTTHRSVLMSLQYRTLLETIKRGHIYVAERWQDEAD